MKLKVYLIKRLSFLLAFLFVNIFAAEAQIDKKATKQTKALYKNLKTIWSKAALFGQQDATAYGINSDGSRWIGEQDRSDIKTITGEHPAVIGFDLGHIELGKDENLDGVPFEKIRQEIKEQYRRGGVVTISWHPNNPLDNSKTTWDRVEKTIPTILASKESIKFYQKNSLDKLAAFFKSLKGDKGEPIPVIFRPYHEHTGSWFWWGADHCTPEEYKEFWKLTVNYLQKKKKAHNLLIAYSTDNFTSEEHYLERFPGAEYVDILGFDTYHRNAPESNETFVNNARRMLSMVKKLGKEMDKPWAITETGLEQVTESKWWTNILLRILEYQGASYVLVWRNGRPDHYYAPYQNQASMADFNKMIKSGRVILSRKAALANMYE